MEYWKKIHNHAFVATLKVFGFETRGRLTLSLIIASGLIITLLFYGSPDSASDEFVYRIAGVALIVLLFPFVYFWNLLKIPAEMHQEQEQALSEYAAADRDKPRVEFVTNSPTDNIGTAGTHGFSTFITVKNSSSGSSAENVQVTATRILLDNGYIVNLRRKLSCQSTEKPIASINAEDYESFRIYTIFKKSDTKGHLGAFADGSLQPLDAGKHFVELVVTAKQSPADYAIFHLDIDDRGYGTIGGLVSGKLPTEDELRMIRSHRDTEEEKQQ